MGASPGTDQLCLVVTTRERWQHQTTTLFQSRLPFLVKLIKSIMTVIFDQREWVGAISGKISRAREWLLLVMVVYHVIPSLHHRSVVCLSQHLRLDNDSIIVLQLLMLPSHDWVDVYKTQNKYPEWRKTSDHQSSPNIDWVQFFKQIFEIRKSSSVPW